ncbi:MAG: protein translocase subunit SecD, partial [Mariprofundaceae bacterium]|nr:protein translocase subunit SecD [Mariprofundaceae bacterium]
MHAYPRWKIWLILAVLVVSAMGSLPNITTAPSWWPSGLSKPLNLGLDLKGGIHLVLDVDVEKAVEHTVEEDIDAARQALRGERIRYSKLDAKGQSMSIVIKKAEESSAALKLLKSTFPGYTIADQGEGRFNLTITKANASEVKKFAIDQAIEVIRTRIDALGTTEPVIVKQGDTRILVQIPGYEDSARAKSLIGRTAQLEIKQVDEKGDHYKALQGIIPGADIVMYGDP